MQRVRVGLVLVALVAGVWSAARAQQPPPARPAPPAAQPPAPAAPQAPAPPAPAGIPAAEAPPPSPDDKLITMNFQDIDLDALVKFISEITGKNFILDDRVKGKVTIISPGKISVDEAYAVFQSVLQVKGFTTVPSGAVLKILPAQEAKTSTVETVLPGAPAIDTDEVITRLIPLENVDVNNILGIIQPLVSANGLLAAYTSTNTMIIIDSAANIDRITSILDELDVADRERGVEVVRLNYAFATEMAATLAQVLEEPQNAAVAAAPGVAPRPAAGARRAGAAPAAAPGQAVAQQGGTGAAAYKIIPDERTNALILVAGPLEMRKIKDLIVRLDVPLPFGTGRIHVYYLKYANAFEIVPVLSDLIGGGGAGGLGAGLLGRGLAGRTSFRGGRMGQRGGLGGIGGDLGGFAEGGGFRSGFNAQRAGGIGGASGSLRGGRGALGGAGGLGGLGAAGAGATSITGGGGGQFEGEVRITADPSTNALIINASPQDYETIKQVIVQLDVRRRQVYVEAIIMEVRLDTMRSLGVELQGATGLDGGIGFGRVNFRNINGILNPSNISGLILAAASNQTVRLPDGTVVPAQVALLSASQSHNDVNILSAPNILTTDNQEAEIVVGQNVPFIASTSTSETNLGNTFNTIERRDVGITLRLTPQISEGGMVRMDIFEEVSALVPSAIINADELGPVTTIRSATTSVVVRDRQTVVIGGLISDDTVNNEQSIPFVSDIPVLGNFFRLSQGQRQKINLLIFLTPHIIRDAKQHRDKSIEERDKLKAFMDEHKFRQHQRRILDYPSWDPPDVSTPPEGEEQSGKSAPGSSAPPPAGTRGGHGNGATSGPGDAPALDAGPADADLAAGAGPNRYVLLAAFAERGTPPASLHSASGMLALALPENSRLTTLFQTGRQYRFTSDKFEGRYRVLEAYPTQQEALLVYPEGLPVDPAKGEFLHWREFTDATSADVSAWTALQ